MVLGPSIAPRTSSAPEIRQEDEPKHDVLVLRRLDVLPELVGSLEEFSRKIEIARRFSVARLCSPEFDQAVQNTEVSLSAADADQSDELSAETR